MKVSDEFRNRNGQIPSGLEPGPVCGVCPLFHTCNAICSPVEGLLPSMESGRVDAEDLPRIHMGVRLTNALLDHEEILTSRQREVVRLYYRESLYQEEVAAKLGITQQAVNDALVRARAAVARHLKGLVQTVVETTRASERVTISTSETGRTSHRR